MKLSILQNPVILTAPNAPSITNVASANPTDCGSADGTITITATGGSGSYEYSIGSGWTNTTGIFTGLSGGVYPISVRNAADNSCTVTYPNVTLIDKIQPNITNVAQSNVTDCGVTDGTITITASSAQGAVEYSINNGLTWSQSGSFTGLSAGTYQIRVRNIDGSCLTTSADVTITAPATMVITNVASSNPTNCNSMMVKL
ncbi:MAG: hypothetical protein HC803_03955 [Saprospiraceae bacterium]|nr:hypothetical protein [Saprospiraceae bacterium]